MIERQTCWCAENVGWLNQQVSSTRPQGEFAGGEPHYLRQIVQGFISLHPAATRPNVLLASSVTLASYDPHDSRLIGRDTCRGHRMSVSLGVNDGCLFHLNRHSKRLFIAIVRRKGFGLACTTMLSCVLPAFSRDTTIPSWSAAVGSGQEPYTSLMPDDQSTHQSKPPSCLQPVTTFVLVAETPLSA